MAEQAEQQHPQGRGSGADQDRTGSRGQAVRGTPDGAPVPEKVRTEYARWAMTAPAAVRSADPTVAAPSSAPPPLAIRSLASSGAHAPDMSTRVPRRRAGPAPTGINQCAAHRSGYIRAGRPLGRSHHLTVTTARMDMREFPNANRGHRARSDRRIGAARPGRRRPRGVRIRRRPGHPRRGPYGGRAGQSRPSAGRSPRRCGRPPTTPHLASSRCPCPPSRESRRRAGQWRVPRPDHRRHLGQGTGARHHRRPVAAIRHGARPDSSAAIR